MKLPWAALLILLGVPTGIAAAPPPSAFDLLEQLRARYAARETYHGAGVIERLVRQGEAVRGAELARFDLRFHRGGGRLLLTVEPMAGPGGATAGRRVAWSDGFSGVEGTGAFLFDATGAGGEGEIQRAEAAAVAVAAAVAGGRGGGEGFPVAGLLMADAAAPSSPEAALVEGPEPCPGEGGGVCDRLSLSWQGGVVSAEWWVDRATGALVQMETVLAPRATAATLPNAGWDPWGGGALTTVIRVRFSAAPEAPVPASALAFQPPPGARVAATLLTRASLESHAAPPSVATTVGEGETMSAPPGVRDGGFGDTVDVRLGTITVRAVARDGSVLKDLTPEDFRVFLDRREVAVRGVDWVDSRQPLGADLPPEVLAETGITVDPPGQLIVLFVQADLHPSRAGGHLRMLPRLKELLDSFGRDDRVAVVSFDSHLKLHQDFTDDGEAILAAAGEAVRRRLPPRVPAGRYPSLARHFDFAAAKDAATPERALRLTAEAMTPLHGDKVIVYAGWGLGHYNFGGVSMPREYDRALEALAAARAAVFVLDITSADFHTLELGLKHVAADTGGEYFRAFRFVGQQVHHLARELEGQYVVTFEIPPLPRAARVRVALASGLRGEVLAPSLTLPPSAPSTPAVPRP